MKPHICYALPPFEHYSPQSGGALATLTSQQVHQLLRRGYDVSVLAPNFTGERYHEGNVVTLKVKQREDLNIIQRFISSRIRRRSHKYDWPYFEYYLGAVKKQIARLKPDAIILFNDFSASLEIKQLLPQSRIIVTIHNERPRGHQSDDYLNRNLDATDQIWCVSDYLSECNRGLLPRAAHKIATLYNGIDEETFAPRADYLQTPRVGEPVRVLYVGRTDWHKGTDLVPPAVAQLQDEGENVQLSVAGAIWFYNYQKQDEQPYFRELRAAMNSANANYLGHVARPEIPAVFQGADIVCVPSRCDEAFGLTALEAMASGCATIAARRGGLPEVCGAAALMIEPNAPDELTDALRQLVRDRELLSQYKERARARALDYRWSVIIDRMEELLGCR